MNAKVEIFYARDGRWRDELAALRTILLACPLTEDFKWRSPVYTAHGGNVATVWGLKDNAALSFFKGVLLRDPEGILLAPGENSRSVRMVKFTGLAEIAAMEAVLKDYIREAVENEKAGRKVDFPKDDLDYPEELVDRLDGDPDFRTAFEALTPGRQRGWVLHFSGAKQSATRASRIEKAAPRILAGRGMHDR
ncbi:YdeI/OmpD-associated family protein [Oricola nitratireducens]|uniref:YdeI/OmpD-associated family protein n=1 Tax=Oricola nitratireducens TaxID=2775868 RepID=UPI0031BB8B02